MTTCCPRCGAPIVWSRQPVAGGEPQTVAVWSCACPLDDAEWLAFAEEALLELAAWGEHERERVPAAAL
jgi:hypothetical protein